MALVNCNECNKEISDLAETCPYCGYRLKEKNSTIIAKKSAEGFKKGCRIGVILSAIFLSFCFIVSLWDMPKDVEDKHLQSAVNNAHINLRRLILQNMNDPKSYEYVETKYITSSDYIIVTEMFRGRNLFGALVLNSVVAKCDTNGNVIEIISGE